MIHAEVLTEEPQCYCLWDRSCRMEQCFSLIDKNFSQTERSVCHSINLDTYIKNYFNGILICIFQPEESLSEESGEGFLSPAAPSFRNNIIQKIFPRWENIPVLRPFNCVTYSYNGSSPHLRLNWRPEGWGNVNIKIFKCFNWMIRAQI